MKVSLFNDVRNIIPYTELSVNKYFTMIKNGFWKNDVLKYRSGLLDKKNIQAVTPSGTFYKRNLQNLKEHSGFINIDIDAKDNPGLLLKKDALFNDKYVYVGHVSVSGNGLTLYVKINPNNHYGSFIGLEKYFFEKYNIIIDKACKDISRLRFVSYDTDLVINRNANTYKTKFQKFTVPVKKSNSKKNEFTYSDSIIIEVEKIMEMLEY